MLTSLTRCVTKPHQGFFLFFLVLTASEFSTLHSDAMAAAILASRDHGAGRYNNARVALGLSAVNSFDAFGALAPQLKQLYGMRITLAFVSILSHL